MTPFSLKSLKSQWPRLSTFQRRYIMAVATVGIIILGIALMNLLVDRGLAGLLMAVVLVGYVRWRYLRVVNGPVPVAPKKPGIWKRLFGKVSP